jgi:2-oxopent-4-enoate/cis-2-oxohex-4-enoate hydratase
MTSVTGSGSGIDVDAAGAQLFERQAARQAGDPLTDRFPSMTLDEAYAADYGHLLDTMILDDRAAISLDELIQPRIEPEIAFLLKKPLEGPRITTADVLDATEGMVPCFEIIDSRVANWRIKFVDTVADNGSSALCVLGDRLTEPRDLDLPLTGVTLEEDGELLATGAGAAALGHPAAAAPARLVRLAGDAGRDGIVRVPTEKRRSRSPIRRG